MSSPIEDEALKVVESALAIPYYAFGDNQAACEMHHALKVAARAFQEIAALKEVPSEKETILPGVQHPVHIGRDAIAAICELDGCQLATQPNAAPRNGAEATHESPATPTETLALLRELNDALVIPGELQPRVDAVLDRSEEK